MLKYIVLALVFGCAAALVQPCVNCNDATKAKMPKNLAAVAPTATCKTVEIEPCAALPCPLKHNTTVNFKVTFQAGAAAQKLTADVHGVIKGIAVPFPLPNSDGCKDSGIQCPLVAGQTYTYQDSLFIKDMYPSLSVVVRWALKDESGNTVFCVVVPAKISS